MALADYVLSYELPFKDVDGNQWRVRIYDRDAVAPVTPERLKGTGNPVTITYDGDETFTQGIIGSSCIISVYGTPNEDGTSDLSQFFVSDEERFYVLVEWTNDGATYNTYWKGFLHQDEYREHITSDPYMVELVALDRLATISTTLDALGYTTDSTPTIEGLMQDFIDETKLEFTPLVNTGFAMTDEVFGGITPTGDEVISAQAFIEGDDEFIRMKEVKEVIGNIALGRCSTVYQSGGFLKMKNFGSLSLDPLRRVNVKGTSEVGITESQNILSIGDSLYARHRPAKRVTNISIETGAKNILTNPSFERTPITNPPLGWVKPSGTTAVIVVSTDAADEGSVNSLKVTSSYANDGTFDGLTLPQVKDFGTIASTETEDITLGLVANNVVLQGILRFKVFIDNVDNSEPYKIRFSMSRSNGVTDYFYNFANGQWTTSFKYAFENVESTGGWQEIRVPFIMDSQNFNYTVGNPSSTTPIVLRLHLINYNVVIGNVTHYYDNFEVRLYNASGDAFSALLPETGFYNLSTDDNVSVKSGSTDIELFQGISTVEVNRANNILGIELETLYPWLLGQWYDSGTGQPFPYEYFGDNILGDGDPKPLPLKIMEFRKLFDSTSRKIYEGTLATDRLSTAHPWEPLNFDDSLSIDYAGLSDSTIKRFTRFNFNLKENRYDVDAINVTS